MQEYHSYNTGNQYKYANVIMFTKNIALNTTLNRVPPRDIVNFWVVKISLGAVWNMSGHLTKIRDRFHIYATWLP